ncbi:MAG TPA: MlaD family protein [Solirubrobacteraceae bacterium]|nr:MlaD family protein [Solirubrobacteraceae bacterium]
MTRRGAASVAANPVLIGAATTLVVIVAVFLAYNANNGLPFVPTYDLKAEVPNAANLVRGNEVRIGGSRVGVISEITPRRHRDGTVTAMLNLQLETAVDPLPVDSTLLVRPRSALGLKYVEITKGTAREGFESGARIPLANAQPEPVEIDEVFATFDEPTRAAQRTNLNEFGGGLAARGEALNAALGVFPALLENLQPVMENLSDPRTDLRGFFRGLGQSAAEVAPVAEQQAALFRNLHTTFGALADVAPQIQETIETGAPALEASIESFRVQRPFLRNNAALFRELRPGVRALRTAAPTLADALEIGTPVLRRSVQLNRRLPPLFRSLQEFAEDPVARLGVNGLRNLSRILNPTVADITPAQTVCNYATLFFRNVASLLSEGDRSGTWQRFIIVSAPHGEDNEGGPSDAPANGEGDPSNYLHANPYPNTPGGGRTNECEAGNEPWLDGRKVIGNVPGNQGTNTDRTRIQRDSDGSQPSQERPPEQGGPGADTLPPREAR